MSSLTTSGWCRCQSVINDLTRYLAGERVCRLHRIGWISPRRV
ncbi:hypothetical protein [Streptomyces mirabilis]